MHPFLAIAVLAASVEASSAPFPWRERIAPLIAGESGVTISQTHGDDSIIEVRDSGGTYEGHVQLWRRPSDLAPARVRSPSFYITVDVASRLEGHLPGIVALARRIQSRDDGSSGPPEPANADPGSLHEQLTVALAAAVAAFLFGVVRKARIETGLKWSHVVPALIQLVVFAYWAIYWPGVRVWAPVVTSQLLLCYALDAALQIARNRAWKLGFGPLPIVLSANLFAWWNPLGGVTYIAGALLSREFIRSDGKHVLNPSAAGLALAGLVWLVSPLVNFGGTYHTLQLAPNMCELLLVVMLIPQLRFRIVLVSVGAALVSLFHHLPISFAMPGTLLTLALLATDPATIPKTPLGKILFGALVGLGIVYTSAWLTASGRPDDLSKVFPVPLANALVPLFDRIGNSVPAWFGAMLAPRWNLAHVMIWLAFALPPLWKEKPRNFDAAMHWNYGTPLVRRSADDVPRCRENPIFCRPFSFLEELREWTK